MKEQLEILHKAFEDFERDIQILESLELELRHLDAYGFEQEVKEIKIMLKDTSQLSDIMSRLEELKKKIREREQAEKRKEKGKKREKRRKQTSQNSKNFQSGKEKPISTWLKKGKEKLSNNMDNIKQKRQKKTELSVLEKIGTERGILTKEQIDKIEEKVEKSSHKQESTEELIEKQEKSLVKEQIKAKTTKKHRIPTVSELVQQTKERFSKPSARKTAVQEDKLRIISKLKERIEIKQKTKRTKEEIQRLQEQQSQVKRPISELKIGKPAYRHNPGKKNIIQHLKEAHKNV